MEWKGEDVSIAEVERELARLRGESGDGGAPLLRTSVMTHLAWLPHGWVETGRKTLAGLGERHPSRSILLLPEPSADEDGIDVSLRVECFRVATSGIQVCS